MRSGPRMMFYTAGASALNILGATNNTYLRSVNIAAAVLDLVASGDMLFAGLSNNNILQYSISIGSPSVT